MSWPKLYYKTRGKVKTLSLSLSLSSIQPQQPESTYKCMRLSAGGTFVPTNHVLYQARYNALI